MLFTEKVYRLRVARHSRLQDPIWLTSTASVIGSLVVTVFFTARVPWTALDPQTRQCSLRFTRAAVITFSVFFLAAGVYIMGIFICIICSSVRSEGTQMSRKSSDPFAERSTSIFNRRRERYREWRKSCRQTDHSVRKNFIGWTAMLSMTLINIVVYETKSEAKRSHICFISCITDSE